MMARHLFALTLAISAAPAAAVTTTADPAPMTGDSFDQLTVALMLADQCKSYRGFEFTGVHGAWKRAWATSGAQAAMAKAEAEAAKMSPDPARADAAGNASRAAHSAGLRERARTLGCAGGITYLQNGMVAAYTEMGAHMTTAWTYRAQANVAPGFTALTAEEKNIVAAFVTTGKAEFGTNWPGMEARFNAEAQRKLAAMSTLHPDIIAATAMGDQREIFAAIRMESAINTAGYTARGAIVPDGSPYGLATLSIGKDGTAPMLLAAPPKAIGIGAADTSSPRGYIAFAIRRDGSGVIGLFGEDVAARSTLSGGAQGSTQPRTAGTATTDDCPFQKCFNIPADRMKLYADARAGERISVFASTLAVAVPPADSYAALKIDASAIKALLAHKGG